MHPFPAAPLKFITTAGTDFQIGQQHGEQLKGSLREGMPLFYYEMWHRMLSFKGSSRLKRTLLRSLGRAVNELLIGKLLRHVPRPLEERLQGMISVTGISYRELATALVLPDLMPTLQSLAGTWGLVHFIPDIPPLRLGCSSFLSCGKNFFHGRNLDFPGVGYWDRFPVVQLIAMPGKIRYIGFTTAGVPMGGITGINEAQIMIGIHQHYSRVNHFRGEPPFAIAERVLAEASNLKEAEGILRTSQVAAAWAFVVSDGKSREGFLFEAHPKAKGIVRVNRDNPSFAHSNFFQTPECSPSGYGTSARMNWDNHWRRSRLCHLVETSAGSLSPAQAVTFLSEHFDPYWNEEKILNRTISQSFNIQSLLVDPEKMVAYLAVGDSPVQIRGYQSIDLGNIFSGRGPYTGEILPAYSFKAESKRVAKQHFVFSFKSAFDGDEELARKELNLCLQADFSPEAAQVLALLDLKAGEWQTAYHGFHKAKAWIESKVVATGFQSPPEYFEVCLYLARTCDLLGRRSEAIKHYELIENASELEDEHLRLLAKRQGPYRKGQLDKIVMPFSSYIPFQ